MIVQSRADALFPPPVYGEHAAHWWANCNRCDPAPGAHDGDGCAEYRACAPGVRTRYCEVDNADHEWPSVNSAVLRFFEDASGGG